MIYCVVPEELEGELYERLERYYADDDNVTVIVNRRQHERRGSATEDGSEHQHREVRDRRRARIPGDFPELDLPVRERNGNR
jgi:hypothetical protein